MTMESLKQRWDEWVISLKSKKGGTSGCNIKSAQIVYVFGPSGTGKVCRCVPSCISDALSTIVTFSCRSN